MPFLKNTEKGTTSIVVPFLYVSEFYLIILSSIPVSAGIEAILFA